MHEPCARTIVMRSLVRARWLVGVNQLGLRIQTFDGVSVRDKFHVLRATLELIHNHGTKSNVLSGEPGVPLDTRTRARISKFARAHACICPSNIASLCAVCSNRR